MEEDNPIGGRGSSWRKRIQLGKRAQLGKESPSIIAEGSKPDWREVNPTRSTRQGTQSDLQGSKTDWCEVKR